MIFFIILANYFVIALIWYLAVIFSAKKLADGNLVEGLYFSCRMFGMDKYANEVEEMTLFNLSPEDSWWLLTLLYCVFWPIFVYAIIKFKVDKII